MSVEQMGLNCCFGAKEKPGVQKNGYILGFGLVSK
jgi:hypothetical protein